MSEITPVTEDQEGPYTGLLLPVFPGNREVFEGLGGKLARGQIGTLEDERVLVVGCGISESDQQAMEFYSTPPSSPFVPISKEIESVGGLNSISFPVNKDRNSFYLHRIKPNAAGAYLYADFKYQGASVGGAWQQSDPYIYEALPVMLTKRQEGSTASPMEPLPVPGDRSDLFYHIGINGFFCFDLFEGIGVKTAEPSIPAAKFQSPYAGRNWFYGFNSFQSPAGTVVDEIELYFKDYYGNQCDFAGGGFIERFSVAEQDESV